MKTIVSHISSFLLMLLCVVSCNDDLAENVSQGLDYRTLRIELGIPGGTAMRAAGTYVDQDQSSEYPGNLDEQTAEQRVIDEINVLQFTDGKYVRVVPMDVVSKVPGTSHMILQGKVPADQPGMTSFVVLTNLSQQGVDLASALVEGSTPTEIYKQLEYTAPETNWNVSERRLPMWGTTTSLDISSLMTPEIALGCNLYRAVAKLGIQVDPSCTNFQMTDVYVYYTNTAGYCAAPYQQPSSTLDIQFTHPDIPACSQRDQDNPYHYDILATPEDGDHKFVSHSTGFAQKFLNQIYVPEADNTHLGPGEKAVKVVVGGYPDGRNVKRFYLIDLKDNKGLAPGTAAEPYNLIRNHSYIFNIKKVTGEGSETPEDALPYLTVSVEDWAEIYMRGVPDQYTLAVDKSYIHFADNKDVHPHPLKITTDLGEGWHIEKSPEYLYPVPEGGTPDPVTNPDMNDWYTISQTEGPSGETFIEITPKQPNADLEQTGRFWVVAGNIRKEITLKHPQPKTANCYMLGNENDFTFIVSIKGNGRDGIFAEGGVPLVPGFTKQNPPTEAQIREFLTLRPHHIGIIWETTRGLINLKDPETGAYVNGLTSGRAMPLINMRGRKALTVKASFNPGSKAELVGHPGGNALIGAFDQAGNVLWSWHLWVCPGFINEGTQIVKNDHIEKWTYNDYDFMDRNIGALASQPDPANGAYPANSIASQGLLFQWGRKDPFIGANYCTNITPNADHNGNPGLQDVIHYYTNEQVNAKNWGILDTPALFNTDQAIMKGIKNPTSLLTDGKKRHGLISIPDIGQSLWGIQDALFSKTKDLGNKTIYDPSPIGFRVPPVDAFIYHGEYLLPSGELSLEPYPGAKSQQFVIKGKTRKKFGYPILYRWYNSFYGWTEWRESETGEVYNSTKQTWTCEVIRAQKSASASFRTVSHNSENKNFRFNLMYVPHYAPEGYNVNPPKDMIQWGDYYTDMLRKGDISDSKQAEDMATFIYSGDYVPDAPYYGFYICYDNLYHEPTLSKTATRSKKLQASYYMTLDPNELNRVSWFPITAVYDPTVKKVSLDKILIQTGYSVTVNSFIWTNSTVEKSYGFAPTAMFLHGTENIAVSKGSKASGRHIHWLKDTEIEAEAQYAGSVRCVRDREKTQWIENTLPTEVTISRAPGSKTTVNIVSVNSPWRLLAPGSPWLKVTPDSGPATKGTAVPITLEIVQPANGVIPPAGTQTVLEFKILNESEPRIMTVTLM